MAKISELNNLQLSEQIERYKKILLELEKERDKRVEGGASVVELYSEKERQQLENLLDRSKIDLVSGDKKSFLLGLRDTEIREFNKLNEKKLKEKDEEEDEKIRVTQLLKLSTAQLEELQRKSGKKEEE